MSPAKRRTRNSSSFDDITRARKELDRYQQLVSARGGEEEIDATGEANEGDKVKLPIAALRVLLPGRVIFNGPVTGNRYEFPETTKVQMVAGEDVEPMLAVRRTKKVCCGGQTKEQPLFELAY